VFEDDVLVRGADEEMTIPIVERIDSEVGGIAAADFNVKVKGC